MEPQRIPQDHTVAIIDDGSSCKITPAETLAARGDKVTFYNLTAAPIIIMFPDESLFGNNAFSVDSQQSLSLPVHETVEKRGYEFTAYSNGKKQFAHASIPRIIVYRDAI